MSQAVWIIRYDLASAWRAEYLDWFHDVHIPEKLARPGYTWAAHYELDQNAADVMSCLAMFGGVDSRVFYDPSPAQIKPHQTAETRDMMGCRQNGTYLIASEEWAAQPSAAEASGDAITAPAVAAMFYGAPAQDLEEEAFCVALIQDHLPGAMRHPGCLGVRKFLSSRGPARHVVFQELADTDEASSVLSVWPGQGDAAEMPLGPPAIYRRVWPTV